MSVSVMEPGYTYRAMIKRVIDGDTVEAEIDCGFHLVLKGRAVRLLGINAPEMRGESAQRGEAARRYLIEMLDKFGVADEDGWSVIIATKLDRDDKYGRLLGIIWGRNVANRTESVNINERMIAAGHAVSMSE